MTSTNNERPRSNSGLAGTPLLLFALWAIWFFLSGGTTSAPNELHAASIDSRPQSLLEQTGETFGQVAAAVAPAVVSIDARQPASDRGVSHEETGSGVIMQPRSSKFPVVVTNLHVVGEAPPEDIEITLADRRLYQPTRVWTDADTDLAVLELGRSDLNVAPIGRREQVRVGQWVLAIGSPFGLAQSVSHGIVSAVDRRDLDLNGDMRIQEFIQTDAAINPGSSGGPLINLQGEVVGINTAIASHSGASSGVGFAIPARIVDSVVEELLQHGYVRRAFLGVEFPIEFKDADAKRIGLPRAQGALVIDIGPGSPAESAGLQRGDVILAIDGRAVYDDAHLVNMISRYSAGNVIEANIWRAGRQAKVTIKLGDRQSPHATTAISAR